MIQAEVVFRDNQFSVGVFRIHVGYGCEAKVYVGTEIVCSSEWNGDHLSGTLEQAVAYCLLHQAPDGATHYKKTMKNNYRYYKKDSDDNWLQHVDKRYPLGWQPIGKFDDLTEIKPLN